MENYFNPMLSEEQMAAFLDGMLTTDESTMVEEQIEDNPQLQEIQSSIDDIDSTLIGYDETSELPLECISDDFTLPIVEVVDASILMDGPLSGDDDLLEVEHNESSEYEDYESDYQDISSDYGHADDFSDNSFDGMSF